MEKNPGFQFTVPLILDAARALVYGDLFMRCLYRVRPYECVPGSANALHRVWEERCIQSLTGPRSHKDFKPFCQQIVEDFDAFPIQETLRKPRVGVVGEILVKYMPWPTTTQWIWSGRARRPLCRRSDGFSSAYCVYKERA
ncbi:MAG: hypothetical protein ACLU9S_07330 [Oscillospiraceae bacterium]